LQGADLLNFYAVSFRADLMQVRMIVMVDLLACGTVPTSAFVVAKEHLDQRQRDEAFADPVRTFEQVGMWETTATDGFLQQIFLPLVSQHP
jgi:hypothetical protein